MQSSDSYSYDSYSDMDSEEATWIDRFCNNPDNCYMCEVDEDYIRDSFNLYGLDSGCALYKPAINLILDSESSSDDSSSEDYDMQELNDTAVYLYGMIHARYIITQDGLEAMLEKFKAHHFGCCSRVYCHNQDLLPVGLSDKPNVDSVKLYCPCCKEIYNPPKVFESVDGAFFGTTFPHMFLLQYPRYLASPSKSYEPTIFGYKIHESSPYYEESEKRKKKEKKVDSV